MTEKFQNKYRVSSVRLQNWDYGANGAYFITICTQNRDCFFGNILDQKMELNNSGQIAENIWLQIPQQFPYAALKNFVVMPNHVHGILIIDKPVITDDATADGGNVDGGNVDVEARLIAPLHPSTAPSSSPSRSSSSSPPSISPTSSQPLPPPNSVPKTPGGITGDKNPMIQQNISRIIRWYKGRCTFEIRKTQSDFGWQSRFYDHIIRNATSFKNISQYISDNPKKMERRQIL